MNLQENLKKYAELAVKSGVNLQKGQRLVLRTPIECNEFARLIAQTAYDCGAKEVIVQWRDEKFSKIKYMNSPLEVFETIPEWEAEFYNYYAREKAAFLSISASDPDIMKGVDPQKMIASTIAADKACREWNDALDKGIVTWNIISVPTKAWAKKVFPNCEETEAIERLWEAIFKACRVDTPSPIEAWKEHQKTFQEKVQFLNEKKLTSLHYTNAKGTDITIGLPKGHIWMGGGEATQDGICFFPNIPTEEIFTTPDKDKINGVVKSALPLNYQGNLIDNFSITYQNGRATQCTAETGYDALRALLDTDEGALSLGEVALIPHNSPISNMNILFYNTLYDENASCHLAIGQGFANCLEGGIHMSKDELKQHGVNDSATHVDFMIGTKDLKITATDKNGEEIVLFDNGNWAI